jgi:hypothetical protein
MVRIVAAGKDEILMSANRGSTARVNVAVAMSQAERRAPECCRHENAPHAAAESSAM